MSTDLEIAAVTATLRILLQTGMRSIPDLDDTEVTALHPGTARGALTSNQLNVFLYRIVAGGTLGKFPAGAPPLALQLCYLITAYGRDNGDDLEQRLLSRAIGILHDNPVLTAGESQRAEGRVTWQPMPTDELTNLWIALQTPFRLSAAYQISLLLTRGEQPR